MNPIRLAILIGLVLLTIVGSSAVTQRRRILELRQQMERQVALARSASVVVPDPAAAVQVVPLTEAEKLELLRLRSEVARLRQAAKTPNTGIRSGSVGRTDEVTVFRRPKGYQMAAQTHFAGFDTPENTLESFLWALRNRDTNRMFEALTAESGQIISAGLTQAENGDPIEQIVKMIPGFRIRSADAISDHHVELEVQIDPRSETRTEKMSFDRVDGLWKLNLQ